jgi:drug/metabolite transporter (DMT)-like permease
MTITWAALSGLCFALIPIGIRAGTARRVEPRHLLLAAMPLCALVMLPGALAAQAPLAVWLSGLAIGICQFGAIVILRWGLRHGPLSPLWCAQMLGFVVAVLWGWWAWSEVLSASRWLAVLAALGSVVAAAWTTGGGERSGPRRVLPYAMALAAVWLLNGATNAVLKSLAMHPADAGGDLMSVHGDAVLVAMYAAIAAGAAADLALRPLRAPPGPTAICALLVAVGSLGGLALLRLCLNEPAATVFTVNTAASLLTATGLAWIIWRERPSRNGWISLACALAAVIAAAL